MFSWRLILVPQPSTIIQLARRKELCEAAKARRETDGEPRDKKEVSICLCCVNFINKLARESCAKSRSSLDALDYYWCLL